MRLSKLGLINVGVSLRLVWNSSHLQLSFARFVLFRGSFPTRSQRAEQIDTADAYSLAAVTEFWNY